MGNTETYLPTIIGISGKQYAGKDALADYLIQHLPGFQKIPLAGAIKQAYAQQHGLTLAEIEADKAIYRPGLIALGDWGRQQDPDYWIKQVLAIPGPKVISDVRLKREYELLRTSSAYLIRLEAHRSVRAQRGNIVSETDATECDLDDVTDWDYTLTNNGTLDVFLKEAQNIVGILRSLG
ncbi:MAG: hypothetical protein KTR14_06800 [Vampirovibrio sp.]|nr:hypothetical protein [Vampirovibrio sp.]